MSQPNQPTDAPKRLYVQILKDGSAASYERDPREVHDNGKPVYVYYLAAPPGDAISQAELLRNKWNEELRAEIEKRADAFEINRLSASVCAANAIIATLRSLPSIPPAPTTAAREQFEKDFAAWQAQMAEDIERTRDSERLTAEDMTLRVGSSSAQSSTTAARFALSSQCDCDAHSSCPYPDKCRCACHRPEGLTAKGDERCERCGHVNGCAWFAPSPLWNKVVREHGHSEMLCPMCFMELAEDAGVSPTAWQLTEEGDPIEAAKEIVAMAQAETTTAAIHAAAEEISDKAHNLCEESCDNDATPDDDSMGRFKEDVAAIISRHLNTDSATDRAELIPEKPCDYCNLIDCVCSDFDVSPEMGAKG